MVSKAIRCALLGAAFSMIVAGASWADDTKAPAAKAAKPAATKAAPKAKMTPKASADEVAVLETSKGRMVAEFWDKDAPKTVANFKKLARQGFYDGTGFHRIIKGFMIQGGDPNSKNPSASNLGTGGPGYTIADEFNSHPHVKGVLSMANTGTPNSAGSQFFIMHGTASSLDGHYTAFGHLIAGMDVLDKIANSQTGPNPSMPGENSKPMDWTTLKSVKIMPRNAWQAMAGGVKKTEASKPAESKTSEVKSSMGSTGMDMNKASSGSASAPSTQATGHPGHDTVESAKAATQTTPSSDSNTGSTEESGK